LGGEGRKGEGGEEKEKREWAGEGGGEVWGDRMGRNQKGVKE